MDTGQAAAPARRTFISHASDDKDRFVLKFAERLRSDGVNAFVDKWEINPGDRLIDKLFTVGMRESVTLVAVISKYSVNKPWVQEELETAMWRRVQEGSMRIIPVLIDDVRPPEFLLSTLRVDIKDTDNYDKEYDVILRTIRGVSERPPLGDPPAYSQQPPRVADLDNVETAALRLVYEYAIREVTEYVQPAAHLEEAAGAAGLTDEGLLDGCAGLEAREYLYPEIVSDDDPLYETTAKGFVAYGEAFVPDFVEKIRAAGAAIVNEQRMDPESIAEGTGLEAGFAAQCIRLFASNGDVEMIDALNGPPCVAIVSRTFRNYLRGLE